MFTFTFALLLTFMRLNSNRISSFFDTLDQIKTNHFKCRFYGVARNGWVIYSHDAAWESSRRSRSSIFVTLNFIYLIMVFSSWFHSFFAHIHTQSSWLLTILRINLNSSIFTWRRRYFTASNAIKDKRKRAKGARIINTGCHMNENKTTKSENSHRSSVNINGPSFAMDNSHQTILVKTSTSINFECANK